jgi:putative tricarboxylic transport membrane protein
MDALTALLDGFRVALTPINLLWALAGVTLGTLVGVLPGIGPALTVALLLPVTFNLQPVAAFIMFAGIYYGGMYGGSTTAILLNTPGESASVMTAVEGHLMARAGRGGAALATAAIGRGADLFSADDGQRRAAVRPGRVLRADPACLRRGVVRAR